MQSPRPQQQRERRKKPSVFERLSQQTTASSRRKRRGAGDDRLDHHYSSATPRSTQSLYSPRGPRDRASAQGKSFDTACSVSTLSHADSVYDRLYRNEPRPRRKYPHRTPRSSASCAWTIGGGDFEEETDAFSAAQARVERRLTYTPNARGETKRQQKQQQRSSSAKKGNEKEQSGSGEVYNRLYRDGIRAQDSRARSEVERLEHYYEDEDVETFYSSRSRPTSPSKTSVRKSRGMGINSVDARTQTISKQEASCSPIEVLEIINNGIDWDISCIEEATSISISKEDNVNSVEHHDDDDGDFDNDDDSNCLQDTKQLSNDSVDLIDDFLNTTNQLIEESIAEMTEEMMEEAEVSAISEKAENTTFATLEEEVSRLKQDHEIVESSILIQKVGRGYITRKKFKGLKDKSGSIVPVLVESALHSKKHSNARGDLITKYYLRERCVVDDGVAVIPLQRLWQGEGGSLSVFEAAIVIQRRWRSHRAKRNFIGQRCESRAAIIIQSKWKAHRAIEMFDESIHCVVILQAWSRGMMALQLRKEQMKAVILIQRSWRQTAKTNTDKRASTIRIQTEWRAYRAHRNYGATISSIIAVQSFARQSIERKRLRTVVQAATVIQGFARGRSARVRYVTTVAGVTSLQSLYRARKVRRYLEDDRRAAAAATTIQVWYHHQLSVFCTKRMNAAATTIQRSYRGLQCRRTFSSTVRAVVIVQTLSRRILAARAIEIQHRAIISIQAHFRGYRVRRTCQKAVSAIILLQGWSRSFLALRNLTRSRKAAIIIQRAWKGKVAKEVARDHNEASVLIQTEWRSYYHRHNFLFYRSCAIILQSLARRRMAVHELKTRKTKVFAIAKLQAIHRGIQARREMNRRRDAAAKIQRMWRGALSREEYQICLRSAIIIQSFARVLLATRRANSRRSAATVINSVVRMWLELEHFASLRNNAIVIQRVWRGEKARRLTLHRISAAVMIQASLRRYHDRRDFQQMLMRITFLQSLARGQLERALFNRQHHGASTIQRAWRKYCQQSHNRLVDVVIQLQSALRAHNCRHHYCIVRKASITIQAFVRGSLAMVESRRVLNAVLSIQGMCRGHLVKASISRQSAAATLIESFYRSHRQRSKYESAIHSTIVLQARFRGIRARSEYRQIRAVNRERRIKAQVEAEVEADVRAILSTDQSVADEFVAFGPCVRKLTLQLYASQARAAALDSPRSKVLQCASRADVGDDVINRSLHTRGGMKEMIQEEQMKIEKIEAIERSEQGVTRIQAAFRRHRAQVVYRSAMYSTVLLQAAGRRFLASRHLCASQKTVILLQSAWRGYAVRKFSLLVNRASAIVQSTWRGHHLRRQYFSMMSASVVVQSIWRGYQCRCHHSTLNRAATSIQGVWRFYRTSKISLAYTQASIALQSAWRAYTARRGFITRRSSATRIQALFRGLIARSLFSEHRDEMHISAICIQRGWRGHCARSTVERLRRMEKRRAAMLRRKAEKEAKAALTIQNNWRRHAARKAFLTSIRSAIILQAWTRKCLTLKPLEQQVRSAEVLQNLWRCYVARKAGSTIRTASVQHHAGKVIQSIWRAHVVFCDYRSKRASAVLLQSVIRQYLVRKRCCRELQQSIVIGEQDYPSSCDIVDPREDAAAHCIQVHYLAWKTRMAMETVECAATTIQRAVRARLLCSPMPSQELIEWQRMNSAAAVIQRNARRRLRIERIWEGSRSEQGKIVISTWDKTISWLFPK